MTTQTTTPHISDIRNIMLEQMKALRGAAPDAVEAELKRSKAISELGQTMINSAKVEIDYLQVTKQNHSPFLEVPPTVHTGNLPAPAAPQLPNSLGIVESDGHVQVTRTSWVDVAKQGKRK